MDMNINFEILGNGIVKETVNSLNKLIADQDGVIKDSVKLLEEGFLSLNQTKTLIFLVSEPEVEEKAFFKQKVQEIKDNIEKTPKNEEANPMNIVFLHYFMNGWDWYITEIAERGVDSEGQSQLIGFGYVTSPFEPKGEYGYIDIKEVTRNGAEMDFYFNQVEVKEIQKNIEENYNSSEVIENEESGTESEEKTIH